MMRKILTSFAGGRGAEADADGVIEPRTSSRRSDSDEGLTTSWRIEVEDGPCASVSEPLSEMRVLVM